MTGLQPKLLEGSVSAADFGVPKLDREQHDIGGADVARLGTRPRVADIRNARTWSDASPRPSTFNLCWRIEPSEDRSGEQYETAGKSRLAWG